MILKMDKEKFPVIPAGQSPRQLKRYFTILLACAIMVIIYTVLLPAFRLRWATMTYHQVDLYINFSSCPILKSLRTGAETIKPLGRRIPKIFHQTYKTSMLPSNYSSYVNHCRNLNPGWEYYLWRDVDIQAFIDKHFPNYIYKFQSYNMNVQRADFLRYMVLYHYGGIYLDMDVECVKPFFPSLENHSAFLDQERREHAHLLHDQEFMAMNSAMGSVVGHPFYLRMLESVVAADDSGGAGPTTGPERLTLVYREWVQQANCMSEYPVTLLEPEVFSPMVDKTLNLLATCQQSTLDKRKWTKAGCDLLRANNWRADASDNRTVGRHLFMHMGYEWGPKSRTYFEASSLGPVRLYKRDRMLD